MSAYTSIKNVAAHVAGNFLSNFVSAHFNNLSAMKSMRCPVLLIHGVKDDLILSHHSETLYNELMKQGNAKNLTTEDTKHLALSEIKLHAHMTHNDFNLHQDIFLPIK